MDSLGPSLSVFTKVEYPLIQIMCEEAWQPYYAITTGLLSSTNNDTHPAEREEIKVMVDKPKQDFIDNGGLVIGKGLRRKVIKHKTAIKSFQQW